MIQLKNINHSYGENTVLNNFNLTVQARHTTTLIGPSGCGKSTILRLINGLIKPDNGEVIIDGVQLSDSNLRNMRLKIGYLIQEGGLFPNLNAKKNITLMASRLKWSNEKIQERLYKLCQMTHFPEEALEQYPMELSGGQRQRVSLMRALMLDPEILLLDEPFGALDPIIRSGLHDSLIEIFNELHKTVLIVTHDLNEAAYLSDNIILINNGNIVQSGTIKELIDTPANPFVSQFIKAQRSHLQEGSL
ncbi:MAG: ATP-binding cassette domain-containing protein [Spirochaetota bacterium]|nr:ATP-binding cassette domain-containing protein [Spirochaetota bacterium]